MYHQSIAVILGAGVFYGWVKYKRYTCDPMKSKFAV